MNAAGPWRDDLENAPRDRDVLLCFETASGELMYLTALARLGFRREFIAWAEINPPEDTNGND